MSDRTPRPKPTKTPLERMTELTRRLVAVPKTEISGKGKRTKHRTKRR
jgi:hypothetical protein